jgi:hypothetical protein
VTVAAVMILLIGLLPVLCFLGALVALDSYKLVGLLTVVALIACGSGSSTSTSSTLRATGRPSSRRR